MDDPIILRRLASDGSVDALTIRLPSSSQRAGLPRPTFEIGTASDGADGERRVEVACPAVATELTSSADDPRRDAELLILAICSHERECGRCDVLAARAVASSGDQSLCTLEDALASFRATLDRRRDGTEPSP